MRRRSRTERGHRRRLLSPLPPMRENALDQLRLLDARDHLQASAATRALLNLDPEHPLQAPRPVQPNILGCRLLGYGELSSRLDMLGRQIVKSVNIFGIPVGSLPLPGDEEENKEDPLTPAQIVGPSLAYAFESTYRLRITQNDSAIEIRYGNAPASIYRANTMFEHDGWTSKVDWRNGALTIEHERPADGAHISERYWLEPRADELHWTATLKRHKKGTVDVKRVFYRAPANQDANLPLTAQLSP